MQTHSTRGVIKVQSLRCLLLNKAPVALTFHFCFFILFIPGKASTHYGTGLSIILAYDRGAAIRSLESSITATLCVTRSTSDTHVSPQHQAKPGCAGAALVPQRLCVGACGFCVARSALKCRSRGLASLCVLGFYGEARHRRTKFSTEHKFVPGCANQQGTPQSSRPGLCFLPPQRSVYTTPVRVN